MFSTQTCLSTPYCTGILDSSAKEGVEFKFSRDVDVWRLTISHLNTLLESLDKDLNLKANIFQFLEIF